MILKRAERDAHEPVNWSQHGYCCVRRRRRRRTNDDDDDDDNDDGTNRWIRQTDIPFNFRAAYTRILTLIARFASVKTELLKFELDLGNGIGIGIGVGSRKRAGPCLRRFYHRYRLTSVAVTIIGRWASVTWSHPYTRGYDLQWHIIAYQTHEPSGIKAINYAATLSTRLIIKRLRQEAHSTLSNISPAIDRPGKNILLQYCENISR